VNPYIFRGQVKRGVYRKDRKITVKNSKCSGFGTKRRRSTGRGKKKGGKKGEGGAGRKIVATD